MPAYLVLQVVALLRTSGGSRLAAAVMPFVTVPVFAITIIAAAQESNMWPVLMLPASPVALLYVAVVALLARPSDRTSKLGNWREGWRLYT